MSPHGRGTHEGRRTKKKKKRSRKHHDHTSSSSSDSTPLTSSRSESPSSSDEESWRDRKLRRRHRQESPGSLDMQREHKKHRKHRDAKRHKRSRKHSSKEGKEERKKEHIKVREADISKHMGDIPNQSFQRPEEVASSMLQRFPELANDLRQLLKMLDDGQVVDISGLTNEQIAGCLQDLFQSLHLNQTHHGMFLLPENAGKKTLDILGPVLCSTSSPLGKSMLANKGLEEVNNEDNSQHGQACLTEQRRRVLGPAMPSAEMLEAAARLTEASPSPIREVDEDIYVNPFIGPPPPAAVKEAETANEAERFEEVERILAPDVGNAYEMLGLRVGVTAEFLKKRYWKLSLLVHPDKCSHPQAHQAFTALNQAFKDLQDPTKRSVIDQKIEEKEAREEFEAELMAKQQAAQWRKIRGEALPGDDELLNMTKAPAPRRDEWMTQLPPERKAGAPPQHSTFFSRSGRSGRGDTSVWTDTPLDRVQKAKMGFLESQTYGPLTTEETDRLAHERDKDLHTADIVDKFNSAKRMTSLLEKHQLERAKKGKKSSKREAAEQRTDDDDWSGSHPWKPWDREKDLATGRKQVSLDKSNMAQGLASRFSTSHKERSFL